MQPFDATSAILNGTNHLNLLWLNSGLPIDNSTGKEKTAALATFEEVFLVMHIDGLHVFEAHRYRLNALFNRDEEGFFEGEMFKSLKTALGTVFTTPLRHDASAMADEADLEEWENELEHAECFWEFKTDAHWELEADCFEEREHAECWGEDVGPDVWDEFEKDPVVKFTGAALSDSGGVWHI
ncbi:hypothetical protein B484DRAFT_395053 [Ochromonadaceae sp. CCMP2298]|nr:hypothetical protein B484DRAFT_395053 [Ochromonadaceae sp. CCMP2298]